MRPLFCYRGSRYLPMRGQFFHENRIGHPGNLLPKRLPNRTSQTNKSLDGELPQSVVAGQHASRSECGTSYHEMAISSSWHRLGETPRRCGTCHKNRSEKGGTMPSDMKSPLCLSYRCQSSPYSMPRGTFCLHHWYWFPAFL